MSAADRHLIERLVAFFATGDSIVANNLVIEPLQAHQCARSAHVSVAAAVRGSAARSVLSDAARQLRAATRRSARRHSRRSRTSPRFAARRSSASAGRIPCSACTRIESLEDKRQFLLNLTCFASCIEGLFFFGAFAYVYFLRSRGLLPGLAAGTDWVFRDESAHMAFAFEVLNTVRQEEPDLFDAQWAAQVRHDDRGGGGMRGGVRGRCAIRGAWRA